MDMKCNNDRDAYMEEYYHEVVIPYQQELSYECDDDKFDRYYGYLDDIDVTPKNVEKMIMERELEEIFKEHEAFRKKVKPLNKSKRKELIDDLINLNEEFNENRTVASIKQYLSDNLVTNDCLKNKYCRFYAKSRAKPKNFKHHKEKSLEPLTFD